MPYYLSFCIPVYNEETILLSKVAEVQMGLKKILKNKSYEILIVDNGSTDNTLHELKKIKGGFINVISLKKKGHGLALRTAILKARGENVLLSAIDLPFGFSDLKEILKIADQYDIIFGSKSHPRSVTYSPLIRKLSSRVYRLFLKALFNIKIGDTQGTVFLKRNRVLPILKKCDSNNAFFCAQLAIFSEIKGLKATEVPVINERKILRKSKYKVFTNGGEMLSSMLKQYLKMKTNSLLHQPQL